MTKKTPDAPRCAVLVGPYHSGKTTLLEALLLHAGAIPRKGTVKDGNTVGDGSPEARARGVSTELSIATTTYLDETWTLIDCPGAVELGQDARDACMVADVVVVVCESEPDKAITIAPLLRFLDDHAVPHMVFVNKMDTSGRGGQGSVTAMMNGLQEVSARPLVLREIPIREDGQVTGHVDLVSEKAFAWEDHKTSNLVEIPDSAVDREHDERDHMLEALADFDDTLLEELLEEVQPSTEEIYENLSRDLKQDLIVPVFFGSAEHDHGIRRLFKALRHEAPGPAETAARLGVEGADGTNGVCVQVFKTHFAPHVGKQSFARVWAGALTEGADIGDGTIGGRVGGMVTLFGQKQDKAGKAGPGDVVALGRLDTVRTGDVLCGDKAVRGNWPEALPPLYALAVHPNSRDDEVKLTAALAKLAEEDPSLVTEQDADTGELLLRGQGDVHLKIALERLLAKFDLSVDSSVPRVPYKETIRKGTSQHARHKKQSGGHGEFGDVHIDIKPLPRGSGFNFDEKVTGGVVPRQYIPAVEAGVKDFLSKGALGFPVVDVAVTLTDGQHHSVDSSEMAFRKAAQQAMRDGMPACDPVLLEPICQVSISVPNQFTSKVQRLAGGRRAQILGYQPTDGMDGWDTVTLDMPQSEMHDLVVELRSATMGVGTYTMRFDRLQELSGKAADKVVSG